MAERIDIKKSEAGRLIKICPNDKFILREGHHIPIKVGTDDCIRCDHNVSVANDGTHIMCSYGGDMADKAQDARDDSAASAQGHD